MWYQKYSNSRKKRQNGDCQPLGEGKVGRCWLKVTKFMLCKISKLCRSAFYNFIFLLKYSWFSIVPAFTVQQSDWVIQSSQTLWPYGLNSTPGFPVFQDLPELAQTHVHWVNDAIQPSHPLLPPFPPALDLSQHQGLFQWVGSSHWVVKALELQRQSLQWILKVDFL